MTQAFLEVYGHFTESYDLKVLTTGADGYFSAHWCQKRFLTLLFQCDAVWTTFLLFFFIWMILRILEFTFLEVLQFSIVYEKVNQIFPIEASVIYQITHMYWVSLTKIVISEWWRSRAWQKSTLCCNIKKNNSFE